MAVRKTSRRPPAARSVLLPHGVAAAMRARNAGRLMHALAPLVTPHAGSIRGAQKFALYKIAEAELHDGDAALTWAVALARRPEPIAKQFAAQICALHADAFDERPAEVVGILQVCAEDDNWEVRETAAGVLSRLLVRQPKAFLVVLRTWAASKSANRRRAAVVAVKLAARIIPEKADALLDVIEPLASDSDEYVRKNFGAFAVGDGLLRAAPEPTLARLAQWAKSRDEWTRWNVASAFTAAEARRHSQEALPVLRALAADERPMVARAVVRALVNLAAEDRAGVLRAVGAWGEDAPRRAAASAVKARLLGRTL